MGRTRKATGRSTPSKAESPQKPRRGGRRGRSSVEPESESNDRVEVVEETIEKSNSESEEADSDYESLAKKKKRTTPRSKAKQPDPPPKRNRRRSSRRDSSDNDSREATAPQKESELMQTITEEKENEKPTLAVVNEESMEQQEENGAEEPKVIVKEDEEDEQSKKKQFKAESEVSVQDNENDESKDEAEEKGESSAKSPSEEKPDQGEDNGPETEEPMECERPENPVAEQMDQEIDETDEKDDESVVKPEMPQKPENSKSPTPPPTQIDDEREDGEVIDEDNVDENTKKPEEEQKIEEKSPKKVEVKKPIQRKRRWLTNKPDSKPSVITISTDSLKNIISEPVKPVPLSDVRLESSPEPEVQVIADESPKERRRSKNVKEKPKSGDKENVEEVKVKIMEKSIATTRKISIMSDDGGLLTNKIQRPPTPPKHHQSNILYITNLVRPFTVLQLKGLLARTGKIVESGFWIDKIKSKCYVKYETEDEAVETRHALHGVTWPPSNPKCLNVDFSDDQNMEKAIISTLDDHHRAPVETSRDDKEFGWSKENPGKTERDSVKEAHRVVREWDLGKKDDFDRDHENERRRDNNKDRDRRDERKRDERRRSNERGYSRERRRSASESPARRFKKEDEPPIRLLDDLFRKTKATPCIYWLPLTDEQIAEKEEMRRKSMAENQRRMEERKKIEEEREKEREKRRERDRERDRERERERERERKRSGSRGRRRSGSKGGHSRDRRRHR